MLAIRGTIEMQNLKRRSVLGAAITAYPLALMGQAIQTSTSAKAARVAHGEDRLGEHHTIGVSSSDFKVLTRDSGGGLFIMEHTNRKKGGPPRHLHHNEDEWFYVLEGEYIAEVGSERFQLQAGDSLFGPREVPHAWVFVGNTAGRLLIAFAPANKMEAFFRDNAKRTTDGDYLNDAQVHRAYGLELLGPPLSVD
jgi:quercetin dioxygenase-like cupin family protein